MICPSRTPSRVLEVSRRIAAELAAEATDPDADLTAADRRALAALSTAIEAEAVRRVVLKRHPVPSPTDDERGTRTVDIPAGPD